MNYEMAKHSVAIEGLPEGCEIESIFLYPASFGDESGLFRTAQVKIKETKPRRIVLEETLEDWDVRNSQSFRNGDTVFHIISGKVWNVVEEL